MECMYVALSLGFVESPCRLEERYVLRNFNFAFWMLQRTERTFFGVRRLPMSQGRKICIEIYIFTFVVGMYWPVDRPSLRIVQFPHVAGKKDMYIRNNLAFAYV